MFLEYDSQRDKSKVTKLYAKYSKKEWKIYGVDPNDQNFDEKSYLFKLIHVILRYDIKLGW